MEPGERSEKKPLVGWEMMNDQLCGINRDEGMDGESRSRARQVEAPAAPGAGGLRWTVRPLPAQVFPLEQLPSLLQQCWCLVLLGFFNHGFLPLPPQFSPKPWDRHGKSLLADKKNLWLQMFFLNFFLPPLGIRVPLFMSAVFYFFSELTFERRRMFYASWLS